MIVIILEYIYKIVMTVVRYMLNGETLATSEVDINTSLVDVAYSIKTF